MLHPMDENKKEHVIAMAAKPAAADGTVLVDASEDGSGAPFNTIFAGLALSIVSSHSQSVTKEQPLTQHPPHQNTHI